MVRLSRQHLHPVAQIVAMDSSVVPALERNLVIAARRRSEDGTDAKKASGPE
jgi:hypothetical protein